MWNNNDLRLNRYMFESIFHFKVIITNWINNWWMRSTNTPTASAKPFLIDLCNKYKYTNLILKYKKTTVSLCFLSAILGIMLLFLSVSWHLFVVLAPLISSNIIKKNLKHMKKKHVPTWWEPSKMTENIILSLPFLSALMEGGGYFDLCCNQPPGGCQGVLTFPPGIWHLYFAAG